VKRYFLVIVALALLTMLPSSPLAPRAAAAAELTPQQKVLRLVNQHRAAAGCPALTMNDKLKTAAQHHANDMANKNFFSHVGSNGSTFMTRVDATGYPWVMLGENIAAGQATPRGVVDAWMNSPSHRANILNCGFREIGVAHIIQENDAYPSATAPYRHYWVQEFGTR
jgi:uncharacterized protein YkwD